MKFFFIHKSRTKKNAWRMFGWIQALVYFEPPAQSAYMYKYFGSDYATILLWFGLREYSTELELKYMERCTVRL